MHGALLKEADPIGSMWMRSLKGLNLDEVSGLNDKKS